MPIELLRGSYTVTVDETKEARQLPSNWGPDSAGLGSGGRGVACWTGCAIPGHTAAPPPSQIWQVHAAELPLDLTKIPLSSYDQQDLLLPLSAKPQIRIALASHEDGSQQAGPVIAGSRITPGSLYPGSLPARREAGSAAVTHLGLLDGEVNVADVTLTLTDRSRDLAGEQILRLRADPDGPTTIPLHAFADRIPAEACELSHQLIPQEEASGEEAGGEATQEGAVALHAVALASQAQTPPRRPDSQPPN